MEEFTTAIQPPPAPQPRPRGNTRRRGPDPGRRTGQVPRGTFNVEEAKRIQKLYRVNRTKAMRQIREEESPVCAVDPDTVAKYYEAVFAERLAQLDDAPQVAVLPPTQTPDPSLTDTMSPATIFQRLINCSNTAAGTDRITYAVLRRKDPGGHVLSSLYGVCLKNRRIPAAWKTARTILLHKKGAKDDLGNWRPISLSSCLYKVYSGILADRLGHWAARTGAISRVQKGFMPAEGCMEHNFLLQQALDDASFTSSDLVVTWLDLKNAFGSVPHATLLLLLRQHGVHDVLIQIIADLYDGCSTTISTAEGETRAVDMKSGVKQGDPLSPIVFNLTIELLVRTILAHGETNGYTLFDKPLSCLAYADDIVILARSPQCMQTTLDAVGTVAQWMGLQFNAAKCASLLITKKNCHQVTTSIQGQNIPCLEEGQAYQHLGVPTGFRVDQTPEATIQAMLNDVNLLDASLLAPWQKLDAVRTFILPQVQFSLLTSRVKKGAFETLDKALKKMVKDTMNLPRRASPEVVFLPMHLGGANILPLGDLADISAVTHAFKLLTCPDPAVRDVAEASLAKTVAHLLGHEPTPEDIVAYLSGEKLAKESKTAGTVWSSARNASRRLAHKIGGFRWSWSADLHRLAVHVPFPGKEPDQNIVDAESRKMLHNLLRKGVQHYYHRKLLKKPDQGKVLEVSSRDPASNHFLRNGNDTRFSDWRFIFRARLGVLPLRSCIRIPGIEKKCRRCTYKQETTAHVLNHCQTHSRNWNNRHRSVIDNIIDAMDDETRTNTRIERTVPGSGSLAKPDIVIIDENSKIASIIDIACPFENRYEPFTQTRTHKKEKYAHLVNFLTEQGYKTNCDALLVGSLGSWDPANKTAMSLLNINKRKINKLKRTIVSKVIRFSRDIYVEHVTGQRLQQ